MKRILTTSMTLVLLVGLILTSMSVALAAEQPPRPDVVSPEFDTAAMGLLAGLQAGSGAASTTGMSTMSSNIQGDVGAAMQAGGDRLTALQNNDGGWDWPLDDGNPASPSPLNTVSPIAKGLAYAYWHTNDTDHRNALQDAGSLLLSKTNNFSPPDGYLAVQLDKIFGGNTYTTHVWNNFYTPLANGTYNRNGEGTLYDTAGYVNLIRTNRASQGIPNLAAWDLGMGLVAAAQAGVAGPDLQAWIDGVKAEINELEAGTVADPEDYDVIGLAGAVYGLAFVGEDFDPTAGEHAAASSLEDLADILASYQINGGGFTWNANYMQPNEYNETVQETAYAILALSEVDREKYLDVIQGAANYLMSVQLPTGGWRDWEGPTPDTENNEVTGEALWGVLAATYPSEVIEETTEHVIDTMTNGETLALPSGKVSATFNGSGSATVLLGTYTSNPGSSVPGFFSGATFHDIHVYGLTNASATLTVQVAAGAVGQVLRYWNGSAWQTVLSNDGSIPTASGAPPTISVIFGANSRPRLIDLNGTPIVSSSPEAIAIQFSGTQVVQGQPITADIIAKSTNLYGVEVHLTFNPAYLQVGSISLGGDLLAESIGLNTYNNSTGTLDFAFTQKAPSAPKAGDNIKLATITFYGGSTTGTGVVNYSMTQPTIFSDPDGMPLGKYPGSLDAQPGSVTVVQSATLQGVALLQGRTNHGGTTVTAFGTGSLQTTTTNTGAFSLTGLTPSASYTVKASMPGYLDAQRASAAYPPGITILPTVTLKGGDATRDQTINILDLSYIAINFGLTTFQADINADGTVNILDLTLAGANFGLSGPTVW